MSAMPMRGTPRRPSALVVINDLLVYESVIARPTGIQRVATGIANALRDQIGAEMVVVRGGAAFAAALPESGRASRLAQLTEPVLALLSRTPRSVQEAVRSVARAAIARISRRRGGAHREILAGDWLIMLGAPWIAPGVAEEMVRISRERGAKIALLVHDLLPTTSPQWFADAQGRRAKSDMDLLIQHAAQIFAVSVEVVAEIRSVYGKTAAALPPADPELSTETQAEPPAPTGQRGEQAQQTPLEHDAQERIILTVGTLHPRKNLTALVEIWDAWEASAAAGGGEAAPLVIVGRRHPQDAALFTALQRHPRAAARISVRHEVSDAELARLYRAARFVVMPSLAEGWGMPVREALVAGRPSITTDAVPAATGSPFCRVLPSGDTAALGSAIRAWWTSDEPEQLAARISAEFKPRTWRDVAAEMAAATVSRR